MTQSHRRISFCFAHTMLVAGLCLTTFAGQAFAQTTSSNMDGLKLSGDKPIQIESDNLEVHQQTNTANFNGNVKVVQGTTTMRSKDMVVKYKGQGAAVTSGDAKIDTIDVMGNVILNTETQQATADKGHFDMNSQIFTLTGDKVVLSEGGNVFVGCKLTVHMTNGEAKLDSCGKRVQIQLDPKSQQKP
jgi:lipopolysaccharide export system protein LptA